MTLRPLLDNGYVLTRPLLFGLIRDPETAHNLLEGNSNFLNCLSQSFASNRKKDNRQPSQSIALAAGFNKHGYLPEALLYNLGFDINTVGTVTGKPRIGNAVPRIWRLKNRTLENNVGLPCPGPKKVLEILEKKYDNRIHTRISLMATPGLSITEQVSDIEHTVGTFADIAQSYELNLACTNTGAGEIEKNQENAKRLYGAAQQKNYKGVNIGVKLSPDMSEEQMRSMIATLDTLNVTHVTLWNTTKNYQQLPSNTHQLKGGISGEDTHDYMLHQHRRFNRFGGDIFTQRLSGAMMSFENVLDRFEYSNAGEIDEVQIYTGLIYRGPKLLTELRKKL